MLGNTLTTRLLLKICAPALGLLMLALWAILRADARPRRGPADHLPGDRPRRPHRPLQRHRRPQLE